jgi:hypothetical protein
MKARRKLGSSEGVKSKLKPMIASSLDVAVFDQIFNTQNQARKAAQTDSMTNALHHRRLALSHRHMIEAEDFKAYLVVFP